MFCRRRHGSAWLADKKSQVFSDDNYDWGVPITVLNSLYLRSIEHLDDLCIESKLYI